MGIANRSAPTYPKHDAQNEIAGSDKKRMKYLSCGHQFRGEFYDSCPKCFSLDSEEVIDKNDNGYW